MAHAVEAGTSVGGAAFTYWYSGAITMFGVLTLGHWTFIFLVFSWTAGFILKWYYKRQHLKIALAEKVEDLE